MKKTEELLKTIQSCKNYQDFISESRQELISVRKLGEAFQEILTQKKLKKSAAGRFRGRETPSFLQFHAGQDSKI